MSFPSTYRLFLLYLRQLISLVMVTHKAQKIRAGHYLYRGFHVYSVGYYEPEGCVCWEAVDHAGCGFAHSYSFRDTKALIDAELDSPRPSSYAALDVGPGGISAIIYPTNCITCLRLGL